MPRKPSECAARSGYIDVGYQNKETKGNNYFTFVVPTFETVAGTTLTLGDLKLDYDGDDPTGSTLWTLDNGGATQTDYNYVNAAAADLFGCEVGWYLASDVSDENFEGTSKNGVEIPYGQGFALVTGDSSTKGVFAGAVKTTDAYVNTKGGNLFTFTGNCMPKDYTLGDLAFIYDGDDPTGSTLWTLDNGGATQTDYNYVNAAAADLFGCEVGWYLASDVSDENFEGTSKNGVSVPAGAGVAAVTGDSTTQLFVPKAL